VAGIDIARELSFYDCGLKLAEGGQATHVPPPRG
jgi:hypothetical protein